MSVWIVYEHGWVHTYRRWRTHTARGVRTPTTVRVHSRTLPTVSLHLRTLTHGNRRLGTVWRDCDALRRCVYAHRTSRRNTYTRRRPETVCVHKSATTHAPARVYATLLKPRAHDFFHWVCTCWSVRLSTIPWLSPIKKLNILYYKDNDVIILRIGLNVCLSNLGKYHSRREIIRDLSITLTNQSLYMPVNQPCWLTIDNAW